MPTNKSQNSHPLEEGWLIYVTDTKWIYVCGIAPKSVPLLKLQEIFQADMKPHKKTGATYRRFKGERVLQLELGPRIVRALMSENNRTTIADGFTRSPRERMKGITTIPSRRTYRKDPYFLLRGR